MTCFNQIFHRFNNLIYLPKNFYWVNLYFVESTEIRLNKVKIFVQPIKSFVWIKYFSINTLIFRKLQSTWKLASLIQVSGYLSLSGTPGYLRDQVYIFHTIELQDLTKVDELWKHICGVKGNVGVYKCTYTPTIWIQRKAVADGGSPTCRYSLMAFDVSQLVTIVTILPRHFAG